MISLQRSRLSATSFTLVEVVLALGVIGFAIVAIIGVLPVGLSTGRSAQDETRAAQIAQDIFASLASQTQTNYNNATINQPPNFNYAVPLNRNYNYQPLGATNDGQLSPTYTSEPYKIFLSTNSSPTGFDAGFACKITVRVAWPGSAPSQNQTIRDFVRVVSRY